MHKNQTASCRLIKNIETKVTTQLKLVKKVNSDLLETQQTYHDAVLKVCTYLPTHSFSLSPSSSIHLYITLLGTGLL